MARAMITGIIAPKRGRTSRTVVTAMGSTTKRLKRAAVARAMITSITPKRGRITETVALTRVTSNAIRFELQPSPLMGPSRILTLSCPGRDTTGTDITIMRLPQLAKITASITTETARKL